MRLAHFFQGSLRREEVTSAFLAMALEGVPTFRRYFFQLVLPDEGVALAERPWNVEVEKDYMDVRMDGGDTIVVIENKVNPGAKQQGQLLRYYKKERTEKPGAWIIAIYVAPRQMGVDEVDLVRESSEFRADGNDRAEHLSWEELAGYVPSAGDCYETLVGEGLNEIRSLIHDAEREKYPPEGDRGVIRNIVDRALTLLQERTTVTLSRWSGRVIEEILTAGTNVTMWLDAVFDAEDEPPFRTINTRDNSGQICITIRSQFKLAGKVKKTSDLAGWWGTKMDTKVIEVPGIGPHRLREDGWFAHQGPVSGTQEWISLELAKTGEALLRALSDHLSSAGFELAGS